ncbi:MAG: single-stranded-DNA-specific exonuclease RecJ [Candidatus Magasanikbacteria bacterium]|nr:single-stranded-DNA-specific exonuclease RecJ [Candidatus Magasanikbacteria bacterium]
MRAIWTAARAFSPGFREQFPEIPEIVLQLLYNRGLITQEKIDEFLIPDYSKDIHDPYLFRDMARAAARIFSAIDKNELIVIHGDYDADGVCAAVILMSALKALGAKHLDIFLPDRDLEGYGINQNTVEIIASAGAKLLISCDCGVSNKKEVEWAEKNGVNVIITDHHNAPLDLPSAFAIIHPKLPTEAYPDKNLSGGGVAFKLAQALLKSSETASHWQNKKIKPEVFEKWFLDLVAISTVADMVPLLGESRTLTKYGLIVLNKTKRTGLRQLIRAAGLEKNPPLSSHHIGFQLAPRINAAGRMKHANGAYQLLISENEDEARELARELNANNEERRKLTEKMDGEAKTQVRETKQEGAPAVFVIKENWPVGLIGLIASRLYREYYRPVFVLTKKDGEIHGSGRSIDEIDIMEKITRLKHYFAKYGGHPQACGFTLTDGSDKTLLNFKNDLTQLVAEEIKGRELIPALFIDAEVKLDEISWELYDWLQKFEPFGENNPEPRYLAKNLTVAAVEALGADCQHLKLLVKHNNGMPRKMIGFGFGDEERVGTNWCAALKPGDKINAVFEISVNQWNGERELQRKIVDLKFAE